MGNSNVFDLLLLKELEEEYAKAGLCNEEYEELYLRFVNIGYLDDAKKYLYAMRYL